MSAQVAAAVDNTVISEIHYHPQDVSDYEFLEFKNTSGEVVDFSGVTVSGVFDFTFPASTIVPVGGYVVIVRNATLFGNRYTLASSPWYFSGIQVAGQWPLGGLNNITEEIVVRSASSAVIMQFTYFDSGAWPGRADGDGSSAELENVGEVPTTLIEKNAYLANGDNWRSTSEFHGNPGRAGAGPDNRVVVNEILAHSNLPDTDSIEFYNRTGAPIDVSGWYVSDSGNELKKYQIPAGTNIAAGGFLVIDESDFNNATNTNNPFPFGLSSSSGDDVYLMEADSSGNLLTFVDRVDFGASKSSESFGRWPDATGDLYPMLISTFGMFNESNGNRVRTGPLVITEIHYNPTGVDDNVEFVQICNTGDATENLANWRLRGAVDFDFPTTINLDGKAVLLLVGFDPADTALTNAFRTRYGIGDDIPLYGPWNNAGVVPDFLGDADGSLRLQRPDDLVTPIDGTPAFYPRLIEDTVNYESTSPWPTEAAGGGSSLRRIDTSIYGDDPNSWRALPTPLGVMSYDQWVAAKFPSETAAGDLLPDADPDHDGWSNFAEFSFMLDPLASEATQAHSVDHSGLPNTMTISYRARPGTHDVRYTVAISADLINWDRSESSVTAVSTVYQADGSDLVTVSYALPVEAVELLFVRVEAVEN